MSGLDLLNLITFVLGVILIVFTFQAQLRRLIRYLRARWKVPLLLWRDFLLFAAFTLLFGGALLARVLDISLRDNPFFVIPSDVLGLVALSYCAYVENFRIDSPDPTLAVVPSTPSQAKETQMADGTTSGVTGTLTDGTGISKLLASKIVKDLVLDFIITAGAALVAINVASLEAALVAPIAVGTALLDSVIRVGVRAVIRWTQSPSVA